MTITDSTAQEAYTLVDESYGNLYSMLGQHIASTESPVHLSMMTLQSVDLEQQKPDWKEKGLNFLKKYWGNIVSETCDWWSKNKNTVTGASIVGAISPAIAKALPAPYGVMASIVGIIAVILIKAGLDTVCKNKTPPPST